MNIGAAILWFLIAYLAVTLAGIGHTCFNWLVLKMEADKTRPVRSFYDLPAYAKTLPFHPLYNILIWPVCAGRYFINVQPLDMWRSAWILGAGWCAAAIVIDLFGWVLIRHPWSMTFREMYLDYQPWITLIYLAIFMSPLIAALAIAG